MRKLATIGYEKSDIPGFIATLKKAGVDTLVDVRAIAFSHKKGFSKSALAAAVKKRGIAYVHLRGLGAPKEARKAHETDMAEFRRRYRAHLKSPEAVADMEQLKSLVRSADCCLMCFERDPKICHRTLAAAALSRKMPVKIVNLMATT
jgi:uncharacterized protein (DUF488 family)